MPSRPAITFPFLRQHLGLVKKRLLKDGEIDQQHLYKCAKYLLFFITEVVQLRPDGMELRIIVERLKSIFNITLDEDQIANLRASSIKDSDIEKLEKMGEREDVYRIHQVESVDDLFATLEDGLRIFLSYPRSFEARAGRIYTILAKVGLAPWWDRRDSTIGELTSTY